MTEQHRATDSEWYLLEAQTCGNKSNVMAYSCILELRDRIEALEAATQSAKSSHPAKPDSSLVKRVEDAIGSTPLVHCAYRSGNELGFRAEARAAIREVAAWLREHKQFGAAVWSQRIKEEAER